MPFEIEIFLKRKCMPIYEEFHFDIFENLKDYFAEYFAVHRVFGLITLEQQIKISYEFLKHGGKILNRKGRTVEEIFFGNSFKRARMRI